MPFPFELAAGRTGVRIDVAGVGHWRASHLKVASGRWVRVKHRHTPMLHPYRNWPGRRGRGSAPMNAWVHVGPFPFELVAGRIGVRIDVAGVGHSARVALEGCLGEVGAGEASAYANASPLPELARATWPRECTDECMGACRAVPLRIGGREDRRPDRGHRRARPVGRRRRRRADGSALPANAQWLPANAVRAARSAP